MKRLLAAAAVVLASCGGGAIETFSQHPGFQAYFAENPPADTPPDRATRRLLKRHKPKLYVGAGQDGPIHFYRDYIAHGRLRLPGGETVNDVDRAALNAHKTEPQAVFTHDPPDAPEPSPTAFAKAETATLRLPSPTGDGWREREWRFLSYYFTFRTSGLPGSLPQPIRGTLGLMGWLQDWHQLDHYTHAVVVLNAADRPVAVMLQQHNYLRTYVVGEGIALGPDGRPGLDAALYTNELFPHESGRQRHRAVRFLSADTVAYLVAGRDRPMLAADDITRPARRVRYGLAFPPPADAFYTFRGMLGEPRSLPGRDGPPGARYNTLPALKPKPVQLLAHYWHGQDQAYIDWYKTEVGSRPDTRPDLAAQAKRFAAALRKQGHWPPET